MQEQEWQQRTVCYPESHPGPLLSESGTPLTFNANGEVIDGIRLKEEQLSLVNFKLQVVWRHPLMSAREAEVCAASWVLNWGNDKIS